MIKVASKKHPLIPDDWDRVPVETLESPDSDTGKHKLIPKDWKPLGENVVLERERSSRRVPSALRGTKFESEIEEINNTLFSLGDRGFDFTVRLDQGDFTEALKVFRGVTPEVAAKAQEIAKRQGRPFTPIINNLKEQEEWMQADDIFRSLFAVDEVTKELRFPYTAHWIADPENMVLAKDDVEVLAELEGIITRYNRPWASLAFGKARNGVKDLMSSAVAVGQMINDLSAVEAGRLEELEVSGVPGEAALKRLELLDSLGLGVALLDLQKHIGSEKRDNVADWLEGLQDSEFLRQTPFPRLSNFEEYTSDFVGFLPQLAGTIGTSIVATPIAGAAFIGTHIFGSTYGDLRDQDVTPERSAQAAAFNAVFQSALEIAPITLLFRAFRATGTKQIANEFIKLMMTEVGTEFLQAFPEEIAMIWGVAEREGKDIDEQVRIFMDRLPDTAKQGLYEGMIVAPVALIGGSIKLPYDYARNRMMIEDSAFWDRFMSIASQSKLRERSPELFEDHVDLMVEGGEAPSNIYLSVDSLKQAVNNNQDEIDDIARTLGIEDQMAEAELMGVELVINPAKFAANYAGSDFSIAVRNDIRYDPEGVTPNEHDENLQDMLTQVGEMQVAYRELTEDVRMPQQVLDMRETLLVDKKKGGFGMKAADADSVLSVFMAGAKTLSKQVDETTEQWFARVNPVLEIGGEPVAVEGQEIVRGAVTFSDTQTTINLFDSANMSTFLHETSHIFIKDMKRLIDGGFADEQLQKDHQALVDFVDGDIASLAGQEKIATAWEKWLREGKAPSVKLVDAFQRFRAWLTAIYKNLKGLDVPINDDVRQVFDRILASEKETQEVLEYYESVKSLKDLIPLNVQQNESLTKKKKKADQSTLDIQTAKYIKSYLDAIGGRAAINKAAAALIDEEPVYMAMSEIVELGGLATQSVQENYGDNTVAELRAKGLVKNTGKTSLGEMASKHNFESETSLLDSLLAAETRSVAVRNKSAELLSQRELEIRTELSRQEAVPGEEAFHNDDQLAFLVAEANILSKKIPQAEAARARVLEAKVYRDAAQSIINSKKVSQATRYDRFAAAEKKFDKQYRKAISEDDLVEAFEAKKRQIMNHAMVQAAVRARDTKRKIEDRYRPSKFKPKLNKTEHAFAEVAKDLAFTYKLSDIKPDNPKTISPIGNLDELLADLTPQFVLNKVVPDDFKTWRDLTMGNLIELDQAIRSVIHFGRDKLSSLEDEQFKTIKSLVDGSIVQMDNLPDKNRSEESVGDKVLDTLDGLLAWVTMTEFEFERLDNYSLTKDKVFGPLRRLFNTGVQAEVQYNDLRADMFTKTEPNWNVLFEASKRLKKLHNGRFFDIPSVPTTPAMKRIGRNRWTAERVISLVLNMGNTKNLQALINGYGYNEEQLGTIASQLNVNELQAIQNIWGITNELFPQLDEVHFRTYNRHVLKEEAQELAVQSADGETVVLKGGYYPLMFDHKLSTKAAQIKEEDLMKNRRTSVYNTTKPEDGMTYARKEGHSLPPELSLNVWFTHIDDTARNISHTEFMRDLNRVTIDKEWRAKVQDKAGPEVYSRLREFVQFQARPERRIRSPWDKALEKQRSLATTGILGLNVSVALKQRLSMINLASEIGWKWVIEGYKNTDMKNSVLGLTSSESYTKMLEVSGFMRSRTKRIDRELNDIRGSIKPFRRTFEVLGKKFTWRDVVDFSFEFLLMQDRATVGVGWKAALSQYMGEIATPEMTQDQKTKNAIEYADAKIRETQPSSLPFDLNALQRSEGMLRLFTSFMTWSFKYGNRFILKTRALKDGAIGPREYSRFVLQEAIFTHWGALVIGAILTHGKMPEWWEWFAAPLEGAVSWIPIVRDVPRAIKYRKSVGASPAFEGLNRVTEAGKSTFEFMFDDGEFSKAAWDVGRAIELQVGVPALNIVKDANRVYDNIVEE